MSLLVPADEWDKEMQSESPSAGNVGNTAQVIRKCYWLDLCEVG